VGQDIGEYSWRTLARHGNWPSLYAVAMPKASMAALPACKSTPVDLPAGKDASLLQRGFLQVFSYRETLTEQICTMQLHSHERMLQKFLSSTSHSSVGLVYRSHSLLWHPLHCLHSSCPQATHMAFFPPQTESEQTSQPTSAQKFVPRQCREVGGHGAWETSLKAKQACSHDNPCLLLFHDAPLMSVPRCSLKEKGRHR